jgi:hypothetical protein
VAQSLNSSGGTDENTKSLDPLDKILTRGIQNTKHVCQTLNHCVRVLISLWLFLFATQPTEFFLDGLKKLEQLTVSHKCVELRGEYVELFSL